MPTTSPEDHNFIPDFVHITTPRERLRSALKVGALFLGGIVIVLFVLALRRLNTLDAWVGFGVVALCFGVPGFMIVTFGTFMQLTYQTMLLKWLQQQPDQAPAAGSVRPPTSDI